MIVFFSDYQLTYYFVLDIGPGGYSNRLTVGFIWQGEFLSDTKKSIDYNVHEYNKGSRRWLVKQETTKQRNETGNRAHHNLNPLGPIADLSVKIDSTYCRRHK